MGPTIVLEKSQSKKNISNKIGLDAKKRLSLDKPKKSADNRINTEAYQKKNSQDSSNDEIEARLATFGDGEKQCSRALSVQSKGSDHGRYAKAVDFVSNASSRSRRSSIGID